MESLFLVYVTANRRNVVHAAHSINVTASHSAEDTLTEAVVLMLHFTEEFLHALAVCISVCRALRLHDRKSGTGSSTADLLFLCKNKRAYHVEIFLFKVSDRGEAADPSFIEKIHEKGLYSVIKTVAKCDLVAAELNCGIVYRAASEVST